MSYDLIDSFSKVRNVYVFSEQKGFFYTNDLYDNLIVTSFRDFEIESHVTSRCQKFLFSTKTIRKDKCSYFVGLKYRVVFEKNRMKLYGVWSYKQEKCLVIQISLNM